MRQFLLTLLVATVLVPSVVTPGRASPLCAEGERRIQEASALRLQARQEARLGDHDRVCDTLDEVGDKFHDAQDAFRDCGAEIVAIDLRSELRTLRVAKRVNRCD